MRYCHILQLQKQRGKREHLPQRQFNNKQQGSKKKCASTQRSNALLEIQNVTVHMVQGKVERHKGQNVEEEKLNKEVKSIGQRGMRERID